MKNKRLFGILLSVPLLLAIPAIAMCFSVEVNWSLGDFLIMGALLLTTGVLFEIILRKTKNKRSRILLITLFTLLILLVWVELAVGILETRFAGS